MSKELIELLDNSSDLLIQVLSLKEPGQILVDVLASLEDTRVCIEKGLLR